MELRGEWKKLTLIAGVFLALYYVPVGSARFDNALLEAFHLARWYAREHVLLCLVPAFFIAGAISVFVGQASVMKYLGAGAKKILAYGVASVSGSILAVCSCTILPLFAGIYRMGAGLGPATTFLYSGPAINVLAIVLTARVLGPRMGIARAVGAVVFGIVIGVLMHVIFRKQEREKAAAAAMPADGCGTSDDDSDGDDKPDCIDTRDSGDINGDHVINIADAIIYLQIVSNQTLTPAAYLDADINKDGVIGAEELLFIIQKVAGLR